MIKNISINISEKHKFFLWLPAKTATTLAVIIFNHFDFRRTICDYSRKIIRQQDDHLLPHTHSDSLFLGHENYELILTTRNPYSLIVSFYEFLSSQGEPDRIRKNFPSFEEFVVVRYNTNVNKLPSLHERVPDYIIRQENLFEDYLKIPFIKDSKLNQSGILEELCQKQVNRGPHRKPYNQFYNQELADFIYINYKEHFDLCGYDKDSWKDL